MTRPATDRTAEFPGSAVPQAPFGDPVANRAGNRPSPALEGRPSRDGTSQDRGRAQAPVPGASASPAPGTGLKGAEWRQAVKAAQGKGRRSTPRAAVASLALQPPADGARLTATARCVIGCDWTAAGTAAEVDKAAETHTVKLPKHPTAVVAELVA
jgi:hypothetical protein